MTVLIGLGIVALVTCIGVIVYYQCTIAAEPKNIPRLLARELEELEKLSFEEISGLVEKEPRKIVKFGMTKLLRRLESKEVLGNLANEVHVIIRISGIRNPALEQSQVVTKQDRSKQAET